MKLTLKQAGGGVAATVGVLASLVGVLSYVDQKREDPPPTARTSPPQIQEITLENDAEPFGEFLRDKLPTVDRDNYTRADLRRRGYFFQLDVRAAGPVGTRVRLRWRLFVEGGDPVPGADYDQVASDFVTSALEQEERVPVWVPDPLEPGRYIVRFTFQRLNAKGAVVGFASQKRSEPFEHVVS